MRERARILVIDDEPAIARAMAVRLRAAGYDVEVASGGQAGLDAANANRPDLVLLDIQMPDIDGFEVNRRLKSTPGLGSIPVAFVSASNRDSARQAAMAAGAAAFHSKPFDSGELLATCARLLDLDTTAPTNPLQAETP